VIDKTACKLANDVFKKTNKGYVLRKKTNTFFDGTIYTTRFYVACSENSAKSILSRIDFTLEPRRYRPKNGKAVLSQLERSYDHSAVKLKLQLANCREMHRNRHRRAFKNRWLIA